MQKNLHILSKIAKKFTHEQTSVNLCKLCQNFTQDCPPMWWLFNSRPDSRPPIESGGQGENHPLHSPSERLGLDSSVRGVEGRAAGR
jgi:hypothetical protein